MTDGQPVRGRALLWLVAGFTAWGAGFVLLYGFHAIGCRAGWGGEGYLTPLRIVLAGIWIVHLAIAVALYPLLRRASRRWRAGAGGFLRGAAALVTIAALAATAWTGAPVLFLDLCR